MHSVSCILRAACELLAQRRCLCSRGSGERYWQQPLTSFRRGLPNSALTRHGQLHHLTATSLLSTAEWGGTSGSCTKQPLSPHVSQSFLGNSFKFLPDFFISYSYHLTHRVTAAYYQLQSWIGTFTWASGKTKTTNQPAVCTFSVLVNDHVLLSHLLFWHRLL